ncbi:MAG TPA: gamma-glutamylcyclotransferase family protein [Candidatus Elarobacter sp.]
MRALTPLFGYGTFRNAAWREAIFERDHAARPARLQGYRKVACASGYLSLQRSDDPGAQVEGVLIELDEAGWELADAWEEVPKYRRIAVVVETAGGAVEATTYVCADDRGAVPVDDERLALHSEAEVDAAIRRFRRR